MKGRVKYTRQNIVSNSFYQLPKFLFDEEFYELSNDAKVLYALLRNRHEISIKNDWYDENDEVFLFFKRKDMESILHLSDKTITKAMKELKEFLLLEEVRQGMSKPNKIYLFSVINNKSDIKDERKPVNTMSRNIYDSRTGDSTIQESENLRFKNRSFYDSRDGDSTTQEPEILRPNHNNYIQNNNIYKSVLSGQSESEPEPDGRDEGMTDDIAQEIDAYYELIKENISYNDLAISMPHEMKLVDEFIAIIVDVLMTKGEYVHVSNENKPRALVKHNLLRLNCDDIEHVVDQYKSVAERITKKKQYILTMLYNCKLELDAHYTNLVKSDMWSEEND